ncbi:unnamed protein product [Eruca vesicaria subsp. sativa]|uniref:Uncharacterized protein n=1 Tax=Eruca vesicaria subsp. sativa TaxID=29727 RepID=A0ABC8JAV5_ERUVS|nr:unnamed protein product [Eruca vesicaria subsp. sativa]
MAEDDLVVVEDDSVAEENNLVVEEDDLVVVEDDLVAEEDDLVVEEDDLVAEENDLGGRFGGGGGRFGGYRDERPPKEVVEVATFLHACEGDAVTKLSQEKIPYFNAPIYLQNMTRIGKVDEIFGAINESLFTIKMMEGIVATSYAPGDNFFIDPALATSYAPRDNFLYISRVNHRVAVVVVEDSPEVEEVLQEDEEVSGEEDLLQEVVEDFLHEAVIKRLMTDVSFAHVLYWFKVSEDDVPFAHNFSDHLILGEEGGIIGDTSSDYLWCIDPLGRKFMSVTLMLDPNLRPSFAQLTKVLKPLNRLKSPHLPSGTVPQTEKVRSSTDVREPARPSTDQREKSRTSTDQRKMSKLSTESKVKASASFDKRERTRKSVDGSERTSNATEQQIQTEKGRKSIDRFGGGMIRSVGLCNIDCFKPTATAK